MKIEVGKSYHTYEASDLKYYGEATWRAGMEQAASIADSCGRKGAGWTWNQPIPGTAEYVATAIRAAIKESDHG